MWIIENIWGDSLMTFDQLITFVSVAKTKNFTNTAEQLHLTQPSVTNRIKNLEEELGTTLLYRSSKSLELTRAGEKLLEYSHQIIELMRTARLDIGRVSNEISIGATPTLATYKLPKLIKELYRTEPGKNFMIKQGSSFHLLNMVISGNLDLAFVVNRVEHPDIIMNQLQENMKIVLIGHSGHPIMQESKVTLKTLVKYKILKNSTKGSFWKTMNEISLQHHCQFDSFIQADGVEISKQLLQETVSLAFLPLQAVTKELQEGTLAIVTVEEMPSFEFPIYLIYHKQMLNCEIVQSLHEIINFNYNSH
jgi:DNA-binding transcriptional LysR family regulator